MDKIFAISSVGKNEKSLMDLRFGKCEYIVIFNVSKNQYSIIENTFKNSENSGIQLVNLLKKHNITGIITGEVGPKVSSLLEIEKLQLILFGEERIKIEEIMDRIKPQFMHVRKATINDVKSIVDFQLKMAAETEGVNLDESTVSKGVTAVIDDTSKGQYYVTEMNGKIVASLLTTYEWSDWRNGTILWIQSVYVLNEYRRKGIYRNMYLHIKKLVLENENLNGIRLYADKSNFTAHLAYQQMGMSPDHYITFEWLK